MIVVTIGMLSGLGAALAYRPFLDPIELDTWWLLLMPPLIIAVSVVYKAIKLREMEQVGRQALFLSIQIFVFMVLAAGVLWLLTELMQRAA